MRSPRWMIAYGAGLLLLGGVYASIVYLGPGAALAFGVAALLAMLVALWLVVFR